jgi:hypothetical protein
MSGEIADLAAGEPRCPDGCASLMVRDPEKAQRRLSESGSAWAYQSARLRCVDCGGWVCARCGRQPVTASGEHCADCERWFAAPDGGAGHGT